MARSADLTLPDIEHPSGPFAAQLALARVHPALAPMRSAGEGYELDLDAAPNWHVLPTGRGLAGYGLARALRMLLDLLAGLTALHETRTADDGDFVHGEVVPALVRVDAQGIARLQPLAPWHWQALDAPLSAQSIGHLAPERLLGDAIDRRADVYSAGVLLWEALAGKRLFERDSVTEIITRLMGGKVQLPELPPELAWAIPLKAVAMRALSVDPEQRFADCPELAAAIEAIARRHVASHAVVAALFATPERVHRSLPPPPMRIPSVDEAYRASHKSSLSALVAPLVVPTPSAAPAAQLEVAAPDGRKGSRRVAWTVTALVTLIAALGVVALSRHNQTYTAAHVAAAGAPEAPPSASTLQREPSAPVAPSVASASSLGANAERLIDADAPLTAPERAAHSSPAPPPKRESKARAAPKPSKPAAPAAPARAPRVRDTEAEQYGI